MIILTGSTGYVGSQIKENLQALTPLNVRLENFNDPSYQIKNHIQLASTDNNLTVIHCASSLTIRGNELSNGCDVLTESFAFFRALAENYRNVHIVYPSSGGSIYKYRSEPKPHAENDELAATTLYTQSKLCHEAFLYDLQKRYNNVKVSILRVSNPYGVIAKSARKQGLIGVAIKCLLKDEPLNIFANPETVRDYIHFDDLLDCIKKVVASPNSPKFEILNVGAGKGHSIKQVIQTIETVFGKNIKLNITSEAATLYETPWSVLNIEKAMANYSWSPQIDLISGIAKIKTEVLK